MTNMQRYPAYKDSGVEWIGEVPEHWNVRRLKYILIETNIRSKTGEEELLSLGKYKSVALKSEFEERSGQAQTLVGYKIVAPNDLVINKMQAANGLIGVSKIAGITSPDYSIYRVSDEPFDINFLGYLLVQPEYLSEYKKVATGVMEGFIRLYTADFFNITALCPPLPEQTRIAAFLDRKTAQIDQAIAQKERLIELLKERRQILIQHAVTRGLNPEVKMKDSGVEWIGEVPEGWEVKRLKFLLIGKLKYGANEAGIEYDVDLPRYIRITDFGQDGKLSEESKLSLTWKKGIDYLLNDGDILFARSGATVGKTYQFKKSMSIEDNYCYAGYLIKAEPNENEVLSDYLYLFTNSDLFNKWKGGIFNKATIENIGADKYAQLLIIIPSINEQQEILEKVNRDDQKIATAITLKQSEIEKLKEYKSTLINSAVTGKIKV